MYSGLVKNSPTPRQQKSNLTVALKFKWQGMRESNSQQWFWRPLLYHLTNPLHENVSKSIDTSIIAQTNTSFKKNRIICYLGKYKIIIITNKTIFCHLSNQPKLPKQISQISNVKKIHFQSSDYKQLQPVLKKNLPYLN